MSGRLLQDILLNNKVFGVCVLETSELCFSLMTVLFIYRYGDIFSTEIISLYKHIAYNTQQFTIYNLHTIYNILQYTQYTTYVLFLKIKYFI